MQWALCLMPQNALCESLCLGPHSWLLCSVIYNGVQSHKHFKKQGSLRIPKAPKHFPYCLVLSPPPGCAQSSAMLVLTHLTPLLHALVWQSSETLLYHWAAKWGMHFPQHCLLCLPVQDSKDVHDTIYDCDWRDWTERDVENPPYCPCILAALSVELPTHVPVSILSSCKHLFQELCKLLPCRWVTLHHSNQSFTNFTVAYLRMMDHWSLPLISCVVSIWTENTPACLTSWATVAFSSWLMTSTTLLNVSLPSSITRDPLPFATVSCCFYASVSSRL